MKGCRQMTANRSISATDASAGAAGEGVGHRFAEALGRKDFDSIRAQLDPAIDFRALTPGRQWEASDATGVIDDVLRHWFGDTEVIEEILSIDTDSFADRQRVAYRFRGRNPDGPFVVEQQAYYTERHGRIDWMRALCSGLRPPPTV
jgi:hypothetical protein